MLRKGGKHDDTMKCGFKSNLRIIECVILSILLAVFLTACGAGGGGGDGVSSSGSLTISGIAAAGAPIVGIVNVKGADGGTASSPIDADGTYSIDVSSLTAPYILYAEGTVDNRTVSLYSYADGPGQINITPITDFILRYAVGSSPDSIYNNWNGTQVNSSDVNNAEDIVKQQIQPVLNSVGLSNVDLLSDPFTVGEEGMDTVLEALDISYNGKQVTVTNEYTGSSFTDDITSPGKSSGLPASDETNTTAVLSDIDAINQVLDILVSLYSSSAPDLNTLQSQWAPHMASDFFNDGRNTTQELNEWIQGEGPTVGMTLNATIVEPATFSGYQKAYKIRLFYSGTEGSENFATYMVNDGSQWLWYGNQEPADIDLSFLAYKSIDPNGNISLESGFLMYIGDDYNYLYNQGVRSAIVTGPGLPSSGLILEHGYQHGYPDTSFDVCNGNYCGGDLYMVDDDTILSQIPQDSTYTISFYTQTADTVSLSDTPVITTTKIIPYKPVYMSEINESMFPTIISPSEHSLSATNIPGILQVEWINPSNMEVDWMDLNWDYWDSQNSKIAHGHTHKDVTPGDTTATLDSSTFQATPFSWASLWISGDDIYHRRFAVIWEFQ